MRIELSQALLKTGLGNLRLGVGQILQGLVINKRLGRIELQFGKAKLWAETPRELPVTVGSRVQLKVTSLEKGLIGLQYVPAKAAVTAGPPALSPLLPLLNGFLNGGSVEQFADLAELPDNEPQKLEHNKEVQFMRNLMHLKVGDDSSVSYSQSAGFTILLFELGSWRGIVTAPITGDGNKSATLYLATTSGAGETGFRKEQHRLRALLDNNNYRIQHIYLNGNPVGSLNFEV